MSVRIPPEFLSQLLSRIDILDVIRQRLSLKKAGQNFVACCPFHQEKTPSFSVSPSKQFYHCFGRGESGNAIGFVMAFDHCSFVDAVQALADFAGLPMPQGTAFVPDANDTALYALLLKAAQFYRQQLKSEAAMIAYLKNRGLNGDIGKQFMIGAAPDAWDSLSTLLGTSETSQQQAQQAGLILQKGQRYYDRFRGRIMFPIRDTRGRVVGFGGRVLDDSQPKYLNSPETPVFHKSRTLYGLYECLAQQRSPQYLVVVEGYMDVVALFQLGFPLAVATLGTATSREHVDMLFRYTSEVVFCFDGDDAGRTAAWRSLQIALPLLHEGRLLKFLFLPDGEDPDSYIRKNGLDGWHDALKQAMNFSDFLFQHLSEGIALDSLDGKARYASLVKNHIQPMPNNMLRKMLEEKLQSIVRPDVRQTKMIASPQRFRRFSYQRAAKQITPVRLAVTLLLQQPSLALDENNIVLIDNRLSGFSVLMEMIESIKAAPNITTAGLLEHWRERREHAYLLTLASIDLHLPPTALVAEWHGVLKRIQQCAREQHIESLLQQATLRGLQDNEKQQLQQLLSEK